MNILEVKNLVSQLNTEDGVLHIINDVSFAVKEDECFGIIGESGCGKTMTSMSILGYSDRIGLKAVSGEILFKGEDVLKFSKKRLREYNGKEAAIILQDPMQALDPLFTIKDQMIETIRRHQKVSKKEAEKIMIETAESLSVAKEKLNCYPHQLSGGMLQRIVGAMVLSCRPKLIIADEPTTALDVTIQLQYLKLLKRLQKEYHTALIFISHDIKVISMMCDRIAVMYAGEIVETGTRDDLFYHPKHPYTQALFKATNIDGNIRERYETIDGAPPNLKEEIAGCPFAERCQYATDACISGKPEVVKINDEHTVKCRRIADE
ncbi:MAG: ABC transporter ATP-binding protein [Lachnospiraceae bacterium]|nr:ABC transporter ATP-binding protein [Lachnospiraceae bacterium]MCR5701692.1 ABC transporter ATP-binding protein [Lachnospiraceae bacterium]